MWTNVDFTAQHEPGKKIGKLQFRGAGSSNGFIQLITYKSSLRMLVFARIENTLQHHKKVKLQIS